MLYADVCVNTPLGQRVGPSLGADTGDDTGSRTFTYAVPDRLAGRLQPGHLVWVPFRSRRVQAVVLSLSQVTPEFDTLEIEAVVWTQPPLTPCQLAVARWISAYYLAPLIEALRLMLPVGISQRGRTVFVRTATPAPAGLTRNQVILLERIAEAEGTWAEISEGLRGATLRGDLEPLIAAGLVTREVAFLTPPPHARYERRVHLLADPETIARTLPNLGHASKQADILAWLMDQEDPLPPLEQVCQEVGCTDAPVRGLAARGWVSVIPRRTAVRRLPRQTELAQTSQGLLRSSKQAAALAAMPLEAVDEAEFRAENGVDASTLRALEEKNLIERITEPAQVMLTMEREAVLQAILSLRGAEKHQAVLEALNRHDGPPWIGWVYGETEASLSTLRDLEAAGLISLNEEMVWRDPLAGHDFSPDTPPMLTSDQQRVWEAVRSQIAGLAEARAAKPQAAPVLAPLPEPMVRRPRDPRSCRAQVALFDLSTGAMGENAKWPAEDEETYQFVDDSCGEETVSAEDKRTEHADGRGPGTAILLYGVTGSGKTEIYLRAINEVLQGHRQAVVLVPEIALTPQTIRRFATRFPGKVTVWHSELSDGERFDVWRRVRTGHPAAQVVVGSRSALMLPFPELGLIVVDEEHESSYKQERTPRYHARTLALAMGRICEATVLLGSATPAMETYYAARKGQIHLLALPRRIMSKVDGEGTGINGDTDAGVGAGETTVPHSVAQMADLPGVHVVDMRQELRVGNRSMFSRALTTAIRHVLAAGEQAILYLNRRGAATFIMCRDCGHVQTCPRCAVPLAYHSTGNTLLCHHCNRRYPVPFTCPECAGPRIRYFGSGTQQVEEAVQQAFPGARTLRWDRDVTGSKGAHDAILARFVAHEADVLVGTQMIAKGLDLPRVTLVGVIAADIGLFLPDFRAGERTFQLLTQVAGRAGRSILGGQVIVQTYHPDHPAILYASQHDYEGFYRNEMAFRREQNYPPLSRLAKLVYYHSQSAKAEAEAGRVAGLLKAEMIRRGLTEAEIIGPAPCFFGQQRGLYRWQVVVRAADPRLLLRRLSLPVGWRLDVDPVDLL